MSGEFFNAGSAIGAVAGLRMAEADSLVSQVAGATPGAIVGGKLYRAASSFCEIEDNRRAVAEKCELSRI
jgi:hypothetical protein